MPKSELPKFEKIANLCLEQGSPISPSMLHGWLVGILATGARPNPETWLVEAADYLEIHSALSEKLTQKLNRLYERTLVQMTSDEMNLAMLLPDEDEDDIELRVEGFTTWCEGFLQGFGSSGRVSQDDISSDSMELLSIFAAFTQASYDDSLTPDENEQLLEELLEHAKVGALSLFFEYSQPPTEH